MKVILITNNSYKYNEFVNHFKLYGITVTPTPTNTVFDADLLNSADIIMSEESTLVDINGNKITSYKNLDIVYHQSTLNVYYSEDGSIKSNSYINKIKGYIDLSKKSIDKVFGWDDVFVNIHTHKSNQEMNDLGLKLSARDINIAKFLKTLSFNTLSEKESITFMYAETFLKDKEYINSLYEVNQPIGIHNILKKFLSKEIFIREANNKREKNYWLPSLNSGLPLTLKSDKLHTQTFLFHDICHLMLPDLIVDTNRKYSKETYIIHRMMSETFSLVIADMLFIDFIKESGITYDFNKRKIYPLFNSLKKHYNINTNNFDDNLKNLFYGVSKYFILGDDTYINFSDTQSEFLDFKNKYDNFAIADLEWTEKNYNQMTSNLDIINKWICGIYMGEHNITLSKVMNMLKNFDNLFDEIFNIYYTKFLYLISEKTMDNNFFIRYMIGQSLIFTKFSFLPESEIFKKNIFLELKTDINIESIERIRNYYKLFIELLRDRNLIQQEDCDIFKQIYPLFNPIYVYYDKQQKHDLKTAVSLILGKLK